MKKDYIIDNDQFRTFYDVLGLGEHVEFSAIKKAYYRRAKECHPDVAGGLGCDAEFKLLVNAFDVLSDPDKRKQYDHYLLLTEGIPDDGRPHTFNFTPQAGASIMDTLADDILEELIVGNSVPENASIQTLMRDLEKTESFMAFREAKTYFANQQYAKALSLLRALCTQTNQNILHHYYLARSAEKLRRWSLASKHYRVCLKIGARRVPCQHLETIQCRLFDLRRDHGGFSGKLRNLIGGDPPRPRMTPEEQMVEETSRAISNLLGQKSSPQKKVGGGTISTDRQLKG